MSPRPAPSAAPNYNLEMFFRFALAIGLTLVGLELAYLFYSPLPYDPMGYVVGRDFVNTWVGGRLALTGDPGTHFGFFAYNGLLKEIFGPDYPPHIWSYPPHLLLFTWPLGLLPYIAAYVVYVTVGLLVYLAVVSDGDRRADHLLLLALAPATIINIWCGQVGFFVAALLVGGLIQLDRRPILAGALFGLLSIKPHLGLLLPLMLVLTRRWRVIAAAATTIAVQYATTTLVFGTKVWTAYLNDAMPVQSRVLLADIDHWMMHVPTAFINARIAGFSVATAIVAQALLASIATAGVAWTFWRRRDPVLSNTLFLTATFAVTPYVFNYDMTTLGFVIVKLVDRTDNEPWDYRLMLAVWATPVLTVALSMNSIPVSCVPIAALGGRLLWRLWKAEREAPQSLENLSVRSQANG
jgi:alpha-1,2-mannosyltransferase